MEALQETIAPTHYMPVSVIALRFFVAIACGAAIGFEREWRNHSAGLRTHILVSLSAAVLAIISIDLAHSGLFTGSAARFDPMRLVEAITNGVAFLAAGMIVFNRGRVVGLTTGAGMWLAGSVGLCAGLGFWRVALVATTAALIVLWLLRYVEKHLPPLKDNERNDR